jgi:hypothetical protein
VARGVAAILGATPARLAGLLWDVERQCWHWYAMPWTAEEITCVREYQIPEIKKREAIDVVLAMLERRLMPGDEETGIAIVRLERLRGELFTPLALGKKGHSVQPWSVDARLIAGEILKVRQELDRRAGYAVREKLDAEEFNATVGFIRDLFLRLGDPQRHGEPPSWENIWSALKNLPRQ